MFSLIGDIFLGVISVVGAVFVVHGLVRPRTTIGRIVQIVTGFAIVCLFLSVWGSTGRDPLQWTYCFIVRTAPACTGIDWSTLWASSGFRPKEVSVAETPAKSDSTFNRQASLPTASKANVAEPAQSDLHSVPPVDVPPQAHGILQDAGSQASLTSPIGASTSQATPIYLKTATPASPSSLDVPMAPSRKSITISPPVTVSGIRAIAFSPDGKYLVSNGDGPNLIIWDIANGRQWRILHGVHGAVVSVAFGPDGSKVAGGTEDGFVELWNLANEDVIGTSVSSDAAEFDRAVSSVKFSNDGMLLATATSRGIKILGINKGLDAQTTIGVGDRHIAFSSDGRSIVSVDEWDVFIRIWDVATGKILRTLPLAARGKTIYGAAMAVFSPDGKTLASANGFAKSATIWDLASGQVRYQLEHNKGVNCVAYSQDGSLISTSCGSDGKIYMWDTDTGRQLRSFMTSTWATSILFAPDGKSLAVTGAWEGDRIRIFATKDGRQLSVLGGNSIAVANRVSPSGSP